MGSWLGSVVILIYSHLNVWTPVWVCISWCMISYGFFLICVLILYTCTCYRPFLSFFFSVCLCLFLSLSCDVISLYSIWVIILKYHKIILKKNIKKSLLYISTHFSVNFS
jgi:hypothetical protein